MKKKNFKEFNNKQSKNPTPYLKKILKFISEKDHALDLGCGNLRDSIFLIDNKFKKVTALDVENQKLSEKYSKNIFFIKNKIEDFEYKKNQYDLINAQFSLQFISQKKFTKLFKKILKSLKKDGIFVGQIFGQKDGWAPNEKMNFFSKEEILEMLKSENLILLKEIEKDEMTALKKKKHWHFFNLIIKKQ